MNDTKKCPFCAEEIKKDAIKCKFCGEIINSQEYVQLNACTACNNIYSSKLSFCPKCGKKDIEEKSQTISEEGANKITNYNKNGGKILILIFSVTIIAIASVFIFNALTDSKKTNTNQQQNSSEEEVETNSSEAQVIGIFTDSRDSKTYKTVKIGNQVWMVENLRYKASCGCWAYDNDITNVAKYGYLYNWETAKTVCPSGWHLPSDAEWTTLTNYLGGESVALKETGTAHWNSPNTGATNSSGFTALPGGDRHDDGTFCDIGGSGVWWSSTDTNIGNAWYRYMFYDGSSVFRDSFGKSFGFSVRCVRDK